MIRIAASACIAAVAYLTLSCCLWDAADGPPPFVTDPDDYRLAGGISGNRFVLDDPERAAELFVSMALSDDDLDGDGVSTVRNYRDHIAATGRGDPQSFLRTVQDGYAYISDRDRYGIFDWAAFPVETIVDGGGDCEDLAILFVAVMHGLGYRCGIAVFGDHAVAMLCTDLQVSGGPDGYAPFSVERDGRTYHAFETTGDCPAGYTFGRYGPGDLRAFAVTDHVPEGERPRSV